MADYRTVRTKGRLKPHKYPAHAALRKFIYERDNFRCEPPENYDGTSAVGERKKKSPAGKAGPVGSHPNK